MTKEESMALAVADCLVNSKSEDELLMYIAANYIKAAIPFISGLEEKKLKASLVLYENNIILRDCLKILWKVKD